jgi:hypothetical protein
LGRRPRDTSARPVAHEDDPWIRRNAAALAGARDEIMRHVGGLTVEGPGAQGELRVDDARVAALPMTAPAVVLAGERALQVRREGYTPWSQSFTVRPGELKPRRSPCAATVGGDTR